MEKWKQITQEELAPYREQALNHCQIEYLKAIEKFPWFPSDLFQATTIVAEESGEIAKAVIDYHTGKKPIDEVIEESAQTAAMCLRLIEVCMLEKKLTTEPANAED